MEPKWNGLTSKKLWVNQISLKVLSNSILKVPKRRLNKLFRKNILPIQNGTWNRYIDLPKQQDHWLNGCNLKLNTKKYYYKLSL